VNLPTNLLPEQLKWRQGKKNTAATVTTQSRADFKGGEIVIDDYHRSHLWPRR
jgi:hypothetical protein